MQKLVRQIQFSSQLYEIVFSLFLAVSISVCLYLAVLFLFYILTFVVHDIDTIAHSLPVWVCVCRLIAQWAVKQASPSPLPSPFNLTFCALNLGQPYGNRWKLLLHRIPHNGPFLIGIPINACAIFNFPIVTFEEMATAWTIASLKISASWQLYPLGFSLISSLL